MTLPLDVANATALAIEPNTVVACRVDEPNASNRAGHIIQSCHVESRGWEA